MASNLATFAGKLELRIKDDAAKLTTDEKNAADLERLGLAERLGSAQPASEPAPKPAKKEKIK